MRINDLIPVESPEPADLPQNRKAAEELMKSLIDGSFSEMVKRCIKPDATLVAFHQMFERNYAVKDRPKLERKDAALGVLGWFLGGKEAVASPPAASGGANGGAPVATPQTSATGAPAPAPAAPAAVPASVGANTSAPASPGPDFNVAARSALSALSAVKDAVLNTPLEEMSAYPSAKRVAEDSDDMIGINTSDVTNLLKVTQGEFGNFKAQAMPILRSVLLTYDDMDEDGDYDSMYDDIGVADQQRLLDAEMAARGKPFETLEEKFDAEDRIAALQQEIRESTQYPEPPTPEPRSVPQLRQGLSDLAKLLEEEVKGNIRGTM